MNTTERRFTGTNWDEPEVKAKKRSAKRADLSLKVLPRGRKTIKCAKLINDLIRNLRMGFDVYLSNDEGDAVRLYACMKSDCSTMFVTAQTMGKFRNSLSDKKAKVTYRGKEVDGETLATEAKERHEEYKASRLEVTPDTIVICPECGAEIRVGKSMSK